LGLTALSAQIGYIAPLISTFPLKKVKSMRKLTMLRAGNMQNKPLQQITPQSAVFVGKTLRHERHHESKSSQPITWLTY